MKRTPILNEAIIERYKRRESSVEEALIEMYLAGVSVRRVEDISEALWGSRVSASTISDLNQKAYVHAEHSITQSMSRKGNCLDNSSMENFFGRLKVEMFFGEKFQTTDEFIRCLEEYIAYYNNERISLKLKGMSPIQYRTHSQD